MSTVQPEFTCHGCKHTLYSAPGGQHRNPAPHSRCSSLSRDIPMVLGPHQKWIGSELPVDCPIPLTQRERALRSPKAALAELVASPGCSG